MRYYIEVDSSETGQSFVATREDRTEAETVAMDEYGRLGYPVTVYDSRGAVVFAVA